MKREVNRRYVLTEAELGDAILYWLKHSQDCPVPMGKNAADSIKFSFEKNVVNAHVVWTETTLA